MNRIVVFFMVGLLTVVACQTELEDPYAVDPEKTLQLYSQFESIPSGGTGRTQITARIPEDAGILEVTFFSSAGVFVQATPNARYTVKQFADSLVGDYRYANVTLISDATVGTVYLTAEARSTRKRTIITFN